MVVERIVYDSEFWGRMHPKLKTFYFGSMLQELASLRYHCVELFKIMLQIDKSIAMTEGPLNVYYVASVYTIII